MVSIMLPPGYSPSRFMDDGYRVLPFKVTHDGRIVYDVPPLDDGGARLNATTDKTKADDVVLGDSSGSQSRVTPPRIRRTARVG